MGLFYKMGMHPSNHKSIDGKVCLFLNKNDIRRNWKTDWQAMHTGIELFKWWTVALM